MQLMISLLSNRWVILTAILSLLSYSIYSTTQNIAQSKQLEIAEKRTQSLLDSISELKAKEAMRESEIAKWKAFSNEKQAQLNKAVLERANLEKKLKSKIEQKWEVKQFTGECKADVDILRKHALELKEKRNE